MTTSPTTRTGLLGGPHGPGHAAPHAAPLTGPFTGPLTDPVPGSITGSITDPSHPVSAAISPVASASAGRATAPTHLCQLGSAPWPGVYSTRTHSARHFGRHWHATLGIGWLEDGAQRSASGRGPVEAQAGDLISSNPGEVHDGRPLGGPVRRWQMLYFEPAAAADWLPPRRTGNNDLTRPVFQDPPLRSALQRLFMSLAAWRAEPHATAALACEEALTFVTAGLGRHLEAPRVDDGTGRPRPFDRAALRQVTDRLAGDLTRAPTLAELAALAGCSRFQLLRRFQQAHGLPPHAWLLQHRLEQARQLIRHGAGLAQAAAESGFADQSHLTRHFNRTFGYTPGAWRAAVGEPGR